MIILDFRVLMSRYQPNLALCYGFDHSSSVLDIHKDLIVTYENWCIHLQRHLIDRYNCLAVFQEVKVVVKLAFLEEGASWRHFQDGKV